MKKLQEETLAILLDSELVAPCSPEEVQLLGPGSTQYLQSLARLATKVSMESSTVWGIQEVDGVQRDLLNCLLRCPHYEVRQLALEKLLERLETDQNGTNKEKKQCSDSWILPFYLNVTTLTHLALHETHPTCLAKVLQVLSVIPLSSVLPWQDGSISLNDEDALEHLLSIAEKSTHSLELHCATLSLASRLIVHLIEEKAQEELGGAAVTHVALWGAMVAQCCGEERPAEVKLTAAKVLVEAMPTLLTSATLPLGITHTVALWQSLFTLLQDEDHEVRDRAADFICYVPNHLLITGVATGPVSSHVALEMGVGLLCQLFQVWGQVAVGMMTLTEWLMGDKTDLDSKESPDLDEDFLFEKGDLNLWVEPLQWAQLLHKHLCALSMVPCSPAVNPTELDRLSAIADVNARAAGLALDGLPPLPQFSATTEHAKLSVLKERATLAQNILATYKQAY